MRQTKSKAVTVKLTPWEYDQVKRVSEKTGVPMGEILHQSLYAMATRQHNAATSFISSIEGGSIYADDPSELQPFLNKMKFEENVWEPLAVQGYEIENKVVLEQDGEIEEVK